MKRLKAINLTIQMFLILNKIGFKIEPQVKILIRWIKKFDFDYKLNKFTRLP
jgi:hypothetical protein